MRNKHRNLLVNAELHGNSERRHIYENVGGDDFATVCGLGYEPLSEDELAKVVVEDALSEGNPRMCGSCIRVTGLNTDTPDEDVFADEWSFIDSLDHRDNVRYADDGTVVRQSFTVSVDFEFPVEDSNSAYILALEELAKVGRFDHVEDWSWNFASEPTRRSPTETETETDTEATREAEAEILDN